ncbi:MAG: SGNH/GDSL hydrolase family protein [Nocardioidaceae bacterium]
MTARRAALVAGTGLAGSLLGASLGTRLLLHRQAAQARRAIGKPLGEDAHQADRVWKRKYGDPVELLLLGDSIAAGLGAERPRGTLGAQLARRLARTTRRAVRLRTAAVVGSESSMLAAQLDGLEPSYVPDLAVVVVGGNDVTHRVRVSEAVDDLATVVRRLRERGTEVVVGTCPDLGALVLVPQPLRSLARRESRRLADAQRAAVLAEGARAVSLADVVGPFFVTQPDAMFALDRFHPSSEGYKRTAQAMLPSLLAALGEVRELPFGHHGPT